MKQRTARMVMKTSVGLGLVGVFLLGQFKACQNCEGTDLFWMLLLYLIGSALIWMACFSEKRILTNADGRDDWYTITFEFVIGAMLIGGYALSTAIADLL